MATEITLWDTLTDTGKKLLLGAYFPVTLKVEKDGRVHYQCTKGNPPEDTDFHCRANISFPLDQKEVSYTSNLHQHIKNDHATQWPIVLKRLKVAEKRPRQAIIVTKDPYAEAVFAWLEFVVFENEPFTVLSVPTTGSLPFIKFGTLIRHCDV